MSYGPPPISFNCWRGWDWKRGGECYNFHSLLLNFVHFISRNGISPFCLPKLSWNLRFRSPIGAFVRRFQRRIPFGIMLLFLWIKTTIAFFEWIFNILKGLVSLLVSEELISSALHLTLSESGPLGKLLVYLLVTLKPCTRRPGEYTIFIQKISLAWRLSWCIF